MVMLNEDDFPKGHPKRFDYDPDSPEAIEWQRVNVHPKGERDFPVDHPKASDTEDNQNSLEWRAGIDPHHPDLEEHTGRTPRQARAAREAYKAAAATAVETPPRKPIDVRAFNEAYALECQALGVDELDPAQYKALVARIESEHGTRN